MYYERDRAKDFYYILFSNVLRYYIWKIYIILLFLKYIILIV